MYKGHIFEKFQFLFLHISSLTFEIFFEYMDNLAKCHTTHMLLKKIYDQFKSNELCT